MVNKEIVLGLKNGIIKELFAKGLITESQKDKCIQVFKNEYMNQLQPKVREAENEKGSSLL